MMEGQGRSRKVMEGLFPSLDIHFRSKKLGVVVACRIILAAPVPGFWIWDLDLGLDLGLTMRQKL